MDFELSDDERSLADGMRRLCEGRFPMERVRAGEGRRALDTEGWSALAEAGVFSLRLADEEGGADLGTAAAAVVFEELGRALVPGPLAATHAAAGLVKGAATGDRPVGLLRRTPPVPGDPRPVLVGDLGSLGALLVVADDGVELVEPDAVGGAPVEGGLDPLTPLWRLEAVPRGTPVGDGPVAEALWRDFLVVEAAFLVGMAAVTSEMAVGYAKVRRQFDRPIGSFQAVKHMCADMLVRAETARAAVHAAAVTVDQPDVGDAVRAAHGAALLAAQAAEANARACIQVHGGMGFTWEVPAHLYLKRAIVLWRALGPATRLADVVAERF
ncbi:MAG: acyl-CoA/acyl-ACP dehydrogenase [Acidobacteriota bacterium]|nr:acyl-CoA/acyl-ACP dehydrogenase [Acidobacteriota bacterium]